MRTRLAVLVLGATLAAFWTAAPAPAAQDGAVPLTGETLAGGELGLPGTSEVSGTCNTTGDSTFNFTATGVAIGPYIGTFVESGTFTLRANPPGSPQMFTLVAFDSQFTLDSAEGAVTGTKTLTEIVPATFGACGPTLNFESHPQAVILQADVRYEARIETRFGTAFDSGVSHVDYGDTQNRGIPDYQGYRFLEWYVSDSFLAPTGGKATGGGQVSPDVAFGFVAMRGANGLEGRCSVVDEALDVHVKCLDVTEYVQSGNNATIFGRAEVNGVRTTYRINVVDGGEPGVGTDAFAIQTDSGYAVGGSLTGGDIQVHD